jgi:hypothetical protein
MIRHPLDLFSLVLGLLCVAGAAAWLALDRDYVDVDGLGWAAPVALVLAGAVGIGASLRRRPAGPDGQAQRL